MIKVENLKKSYGSQIALKGISFVVPISSLGHYLFIHSPSTSLIVVNSKSFNNLANRFSV